MYFFMILIYVLSFFSFVALAFAGLQGLFEFSIFGVHHASFGFVAAILYLFTEVLVMFFFVGTGVSIKEYIQENSVDIQFHKRSIDIKRKLSPPTLLNVLFDLVPRLTLLARSRSSDAVPRVVARQSAVLAHGNARR